MRRPESAVLALARRLRAATDSIRCRLLMLIGGSLALLLAGYVTWSRLFFAVVGLACGVFFFAYAVKYYVSVALILLINGENGLLNGGNNLHDKSQRNGLLRGLRKVLGNGIDNAFANGYHLRPEVQPFVSVHLPLYNEKEVVDRLLVACTSLDYEKYEIVVADDSTDETTDILERWADDPRVKISHRQDRKGFKGGALQAAVRCMDPRTEFVVVFDADFIPPPDIISQFLAYFYTGNGEGVQLADERVAVVQGYQWHMLNAGENWITRGIRVEFSGSYVVERPSQELLGGMKMISGSVFMIRADVLREHGWGTSITEDWELTLRLYLDGYKVLYTPFIQAPAECVSNFRQLTRQRMRWAEGHTHNVKKHFGKTLRSRNISRREKAEFLYYAPYYLQSIFFILGTSSWFVSELVVRCYVPYWTALLGWCLVFSNLFSLVLMNLSGLFWERGVRRSWAGIFSFLVLSNLLVSFQAYAALKGLLEKDEGGWHRTPKTGRITEIIGRLRFGKKLRRLLPKTRTGHGVATHAIAGSERVEEALWADIEDAAAEGAHFSAPRQRLLEAASKLIESMSRAAERPVSRRGAKARDRGLLAERLARGLQRFLLVCRRLRLRPRLAVGAIILLLVAIAGLAIMSTQVEAVADNSSTFWFYEDTAPLTYMMYQTQPVSGTSQSMTAWARFYSDTFDEGQALGAGTATVYVVADNSAAVAKDMPVTLRVYRGGAEVAELGSGTITVPRKVSTPTLYSTSFPHLAFDFQAGDRLQLEIAPPGSVVVFWDGSYNASRLEVGIIVPESAVAFLLLAPFIPVAISVLRRRRDASQRRRGVR